MKKRYKVLNGANEYHGAYDTLEEARGAIAYDRLLVWSIWFTGPGVESGVLLDERTAEDGETA